MLCSAHSSFRFPNEKSKSGKHASKTNPVTPEKYGVVLCIFLVLLTIVRNLLALSMGEHILVPFIRNMFIAFEYLASHLGCFTTLFLTFKKRVCFWLCFSRCFLFLSRFPFIFVFCFCFFSFSFF